MPEDLNRGGLWCPECDREYRPGFGECFYCKVALTDMAPTEPVEPDHDMLEYDLSDWSDEQRRAVTLLLRGNDVEPMWLGTTLVVPIMHEVYADMAIDEVDDDTPIDVIESVVEPRLDVASVARRVGAKVIDGLVGSVVFGVLVALTVERRWPALPALGAIFEIACVATWGQTPGRRVLGIKVVDFESGAVPSWRSSFVRYLVPVAPGLALSAMRAGAVVLVGALVWQPIVYVGLFTNPRRQGLHDRAAGTVTIRWR